LRLLKNDYGNATAPRGLWQDVDKTFKKLGGRRAVGDAERNDNLRNEGDEYTTTTTGFVGGRVDDFNRVEVRDLTDKAYMLGDLERHQFRRAGLDLEVHQRGPDCWISIN